MDLDTHTKISWNVIDKMLSNSNVLVEHHISSYNNFFSSSIKQIFNDNNPVNIYKKYNNELTDYDLKCELFFGGKDGSKLYIGKPILYENEYTHLLYPNEARLKNKTYGFNIYYDIDIEFIIRKTDNTIQNISITLEQINLGKFPIMLHSNFCLLNNLPYNSKYFMGECINDKGGYFIIDGKEKVIVCQEQFANNSLYIKDDYNDEYSHSAEIRSVSEDSSKPIRTTAVRIVRPNTKYTNENIVVNIPNVRKPIPLFIVFRALGVITDKEIISYCLLDIDKYHDYVDLFTPSIHDSHLIFTQDLALKFISTFTKHKTIPNTMDILTNYFIPHMGELHFKQKALFLGNMVFKLLRVFKQVDPPTDRDSFLYKRVETPGSLLHDLFREHYRTMLSNIFKKFDNEYYYKEKSAIYDDENFINLIKNNYTDFFKEQGFYVQDGFNKAFKGQWGSQPNTTKEGIVQDLNRLSFNSAISHCRKINLPLDPTAKVVAPRLLHSSQWGFIDPVDTPDGGHIGLHKHLAISCKISNSTPLKDIVDWIKTNHTELILLTDTILHECCHQTKIFVNGSWIGITHNPLLLVNIFNIHKRNGLIPLLATITFNIHDNIIECYCDSGRLIRPVFYIENNMPSYNKTNILSNINKLLWNQIVSGTLEKTNNDINYKHVFTIQELFSKSLSIKQLEKSQGIVDFIDSSIMNNALVNIYDTDLQKYTHIEIHPSLIFGVMGNQIVYPNHNQLPRDLFSCGQSKQAVSLYSSNYQFRMDKMGVILNYGQIPIVKSKFMKYINKEQHPYGENVIVAIMSYNGYNVEDSILFNEGSVQRGLFRTTYFTTYEDYEKSSSNNTILTSQTTFSNIENIPNIKNILPSFEYHHLDEHGVIKQETIMHDKIILLGKVTKENENMYSQSLKTKKGQLGIVDKVFLSDDDEGHRLAKIRIREERTPAIGDKFCSRCGQKGTVGLLIPEENMPFTSDGIKPDIIINPHALPSRMTIGQLIETISGKASLHLGSFANCTAFDDTNVQNYSSVLSDLGYHSQGNETLYDGLTGEQIESDIFIGPTYYMRLKHMVKDKINHRSGGPRDNLTRQTVQGRANDGGLRVGEMERDAILCHGMSSFLKNSLVDRGDKFSVAICNHSGTIAIHNKFKNIYYSPYVDGPITFGNDISNEKNSNDITKEADPIDLLNNFRSISYATYLGKEFSIIEIPYAFKLLSQELTTMNIQMRIITSDNIDSLTNYSSSTTKIPLHKIIEPDAPILKDNNNFDEGVPESKHDDVFDEGVPESKHDDVFDEGVPESKANPFDDISDSRIVKHTIFNIGDNVYYLPSQNNQPWIIKNIDHSHSKNNITISTIVNDNVSQIPSGSQIQETFDKLSNQIFKFAILNVSIEQIKHFGDPLKLSPPIKPKNINTENIILSKNTSISQDKVDGSILDSQPDITDLTDNTDIKIIKTDSDAFTDDKEKSSDVKKINI